VDAKLNRTVVQVNPFLAPGDAIGNEVLTLDTLFRRWGYSTKIYALGAHPQMQPYAKNWTDYRPASGDLIFYHHSVGAEISTTLMKLKRPVLMLYHNITPAQYFADTNPLLMELCSKGREELRLLRPLVKLALADSEFSRQELNLLGYQQTDVLPIIIDFSRYEVPSNPTLVSKYNDGVPNILFVGRVAPNKRIQDLIKAVAVYQRCIDQRIRLFIVGTADGMEPYASRLYALIDRLKLNKVFFLPHADTRDLVTYYRIATLFVTMSEHEGFCVPLIESMHFGIPIIAFNSTAVPETLSGVGVLLDEKDPATVSEAMRLLIENNVLRDEIVAKQRERLKDFSNGMESAIGRLRAHLETFSIK